MPLFAEEGIWVDAGALTRSCLTQLSQLWTRGRHGLDEQATRATFEVLPPRSGLFRRRRLVHLSVLGGSRFLLRQSAQPPLMQDQIPILVMVCPSRKQRPAFPYQCPGFGSQRLQVVAQNPRGLPHHRQSAVVQCLLPSRGAASLDYRASHVSAYLLRRFRSLMPFVQLVNSVPTPSLRNFDNKVLANLENTAVTCSD